jgi:rhodanese-related sulfurtransferase
MRGAIMAGVLAVGLTGLKGKLLASDHTTDSLSTVKKAVANGTAILLDVREKAEWDRGHLKDAKWLPLSTINAGVTAEELARLVPKDAIIYCHCASGVRCVRAAKILRQFGYDVRPLKPGFADLVRAGFPAEK